jgi:Amt family ammonium transporter
MSSENGESSLAVIETAEASKTPSSAVPMDAAIPVINRARRGAKFTKVSVITNQERFSQLQTNLDNIGITGLTVTNVLGYGIQKGQTEYYRGAPVKTRLLPKVKVDIVVCKIPTQTVIDTIKNTLYTGNIGDGKIFVYDVENVIKIRTGEEGYDALQDET